MTTQADQSTQIHGGRLIAKRLKAHGVSRLFTLSGGHLFSVFDGCRAEGIEIVDVRHEQAATFAAEGWAKVTREPGVAALTAGPGVTNGMSAMAGAMQNHSPMLVLGGRAPQMRWGQGSLQEIDHVPFVRPVTKYAATADSTAEIPGLVDDALASALRPHSGPAFVDLPLDFVFMEAPEPEEGPTLPDPLDEPVAEGVERALALLAEAGRPVIMAGTDMYWGKGERALLELAERRGIPVFLNGLARGCVPADHELFFSRARSEALKGADVALVVGVPMDFRLGFGGSFGEDTKIIVLGRTEPERDHPRPPAVELYGGGGARRGGAAGPRPAGSRGGGTGRCARWRATVATRRRGSPACARSRPRSARPSRPSCPTTARRCTRCGSTRSSARCSTATRSSSATAATSSPTRAASCRPMSRAAGSTPAPTAASAPARATRWPRRSRGPTSRSCCCSATARSALPGWSSTRSPATGSTSSASWATTGSGRSRSTRWSSSTATAWRPSCGPRRGTTRWSRHWAGTASSCRRPASSSPRWSVRSRPASPPW